MYIPFTLFFHVHISYKDQFIQLDYSMILVSFREYHTCLKSMESKGTKRQNGVIISIYMHRKEVYNWTGDKSKFMSV